MMRERISSSNSPGLLDLPHQQADAPLAFLGRRDVAGDLGSADDLAPHVPDRRDGQRDGDQRAVLAPPCCLVARHALAIADAANDVGLLAPQMIGNEHQDRLSDRLVGGVAEHTLGRMVPVGDDARQILADDCVVG